jgi:hypothetical protein
MRWRRARECQFLNQTSRATRIDCLPPTRLINLARSMLRTDLKRHATARHYEVMHVIRKLKSGEYRLYSRKTDPKTGKHKNLGTFASRAAAAKHEREVQYFKRHG